MNTINFWDVKSFDQAQAIAADESARTGRTVLAVDRGPNVWPRYNIVTPPQVGEDVSEGFNGDYYPVGKVEKIGKDYKRIKAGGRWFYRRKLTARWCQGGSPFCLVQGTRHEWNREF